MIGELIDDGYDPVGYIVDAIADEVEDAADETICTDGTDIDLIADITDKDVEEIAPQLEREPDVDFLDDEIDEDEVIYTTVDNGSVEDQDILAALNNVKLGENGIPDIF